MGFWMTFNRYAQIQQILKPFQWVLTSPFVVGLAGAYIYQLYYDTLVVVVLVLPNRLLSVLFL